MTTLTLQPDGTAGVDTYIRDGANADTNYGTANGIVLKNTVTTGFNRRGLLAFSLASLPVGSTVTGATLSLVWDTSQAYSAPMTTTLYECLRAWTEAGATWNTYDGVGAWGTAGCNNATTDYGGATPLASHTVNAAPAGGDVFAYTGSALNTAIQNAAGGTLRLLLVIATAELNWGVASSDHATAAWRPKLVVDYTEPATANPTSWPDRAFPLRAYPVRYWPVPGALMALFRRLLGRRTGSRGSQ